MQRNHLGTLDINYCTILNLTLNLQAVNMLTGSGYNTGVARKWLAQVSYKYNIQVGFTCTSGSTRTGFKKFCKEGRLKMT